MINLMSPDRMFHIDSRRCTGPFDPPDTPSTALLHSHDTTDIWVELQGHRYDLSCKVAFTMYLPLTI